MLINRKNIEVGDGEEIPVVFGNKKIGKLTVYGSRYSFSAGNREAVADFVENNEVQYSIEWLTKKGKREKVARITIIGGEE